MLVAAAAGEQVGGRGQEQHVAAIARNAELVGIGIGQRAADADPQPHRRAGDYVAHEHVVVAVMVVGGQAVAVGRERDIAAAGGERAPVHPRDASAGRAARAHIDPLQRPGPLIAQHELAPLRPAHAAHEVGGPRGHQLVAGVVGQAQRPARAVRLAARRRHADALRRSRGQCRQRRRSGPADEQNGGDGQQRGPSHLCQATGNLISKHTAPLDQGCHRLPGPISAPPRAADPANSLGRLAARLAVLSV